MHCALYQSLWQGHTVIKQIRTHTHTQNIHSPTCHQSSFQFKVYLGQQALDGRVGRVDPSAEVLSPDGRSHALSTSRGYDFGNEQPASSLLQKIETICESMICNDLSHFHIGTVCLVPISWNVWNVEISKHTEKGITMKPPRNGGIGSLSTPC